ncbi:Uncharacterised protein [Serratia proteamaculans]|nr:Uncharacterised protein [Serratia proteamaculans]
MLHILCHFFDDFNCVLFLQKINYLKANNKFPCTWIKIPLAVRG